MEGRQKMMTLLQEEAELEEIVKWSEWMHFLRQTA